MKKTLINFYQAGHNLDALLSAFEKFERELSWFQAEVDSGRLDYVEAEEAIDQNIYDIRSLTNKIAEQLHDAENNLIEADETYEEENCEESEESE